MRIKNFNSHEVIPREVYPPELEVLGEYPVESVRVDEAEAAVVRGQQGLQLGEVAEGAAADRLESVNTV